MKEFTIGQNDAGQRLDKFLGKAVPLLPSSMMYKGMAGKLFLVISNRQVKPTQEVIAETSLGLQLLMG